jgi:hypothetical protein
VEYCRRGKHHRFERLSGLKALTLTVVCSLVACTSTGSSGGGTGGSGGGGTGSGGASGSGGNSGTVSGSGGAAAGSGGAGGMVAGTGGAQSGGADGSITDASDGPSEAGPPCNISPGMALQFQGMTPDLVQANIGKLPLGKASRTVEFWAYFDGTDRSWVNEHGFFEYGHRAGDAMYPTQGCHEFAINSTAWPQGQAIGMIHPYGNCNSVDNFFNLPAGTPRVGWLHISFGYDGQTNHFQLTINGSAMLAIGTGAGASGRTHSPDQWTAEAGWNSTMSPLSIGTTVEFAGPTGWQGKIDEFRVWNVFRTEAEIKASMKVMLKGNEPGLIAYYKFDEGTGTTIADATGDASNAAKMASATKPQWVTSDIPGPFTCAR